MTLMGLILTDRAREVGGAETLIFRKLLLEVLQPPADLRNHITVLRKPRLARLRGDQHEKDPACFSAFKFLCVRFRMERGPDRSKRPAQQFRQGADRNYGCSGQRNSGESPGRREMRGRNSVDDQRRLYRRWPSWAGRRNVPYSQW